jgi:hypothetical protein
VKAKDLFEGDFALDVVDMASANVVRNALHEPRFFSEDGDFVWEF